MKRVLLSFSFIFFIFSLSSCGWYCDYDYYCYDDYYYDDYYYDDYYYDDDDWYYYYSINSGMKDLEKIGNKVEKRKLRKMVNKIKTDFGLTEERSFKVAQLVHQVNTLKTDRRLTDRDTDSFFKELIGVGLDEAKDALKRHKEGGESLTPLFEKAALTNGISPEDVSDIYQNHFSK